MRKHVFDRPNGISLSTRALSFLDGLMIGTCYGLATILGVVSAQRTTAPNFSIPEKVVLGQGSPWSVYWYCPVGCLIWFLSEHCLYCQA